MVATAIAAAVALGSVPATTSAAGDDEPFALPGSTPSAIAADVDGDGARELVRLTGSPEDAIRLEVWDLVEGQWAATLSAELGPLLGIARGSGGIAATALVRTHVDGTDRALLFIGGPVSESGRSECCLTVHEVFDGRDGPALRPMPAPQLPAESIVVVDLDGDGTDELLASRINWSEDGSRSSTNVAVLAREADAWGAIAAWDEPGAWWVNSTAESDGAPGAELLAGNETQDLMRLAWIDGAVAIEQAALTVDHEQAWVAGSVDGNLIAASSTALALVHWPRDGEPTILARHETEWDYPLVAVTGSDAEALIVVQEHTDRGAVVPVSRVLDARLRPIGEVPSSATAASLAELADQLSRAGWEGGPPTNIWPYFGPDDGEVDGAAESYIVGGMRITSSPGGSFDVQPSATLVGRPIGRVGPEGGWVALGDVYASTGAVAYLQIGSPFDGSRLTLVPLATFQSPAERTLATSITLDGGIALGDDGGTTTILAGPTGLDIIISVLPGSQAVSWDGTRATDHGEITEAELRLSVEPPSRPRPGREYSFERDLILVGLDGTATVHRWEGTFALEAPELTAWTDQDALSLEATVAGRTSPLSVVTVDGAVVAVNDFGAYRATVSAPPWPRNVVVVARDPFGGEQRTTVEVIGLVDYRGLPWGPIAGGLTVLVGGVFFVRTPRHRPAPKRMALDDARLEDLDGDAI